MRYEEPDMSQQSQQTSQSKSSKSTTLLSVADTIRAAIARSDAGYREAGRLFTEQRAALERGEWLAWLKAEGFSKSTAYRYMEYSKLPTVGSLTFAEFCHPAETAAKAARALGYESVGIDWDDPDGAAEDFLPEANLVEPQVEPEPESITEEQAEADSNPKIILGLRRYAGCLKGRTFTPEQLKSLREVQDQISAVFEAQP
jgi:hypothetical protein